MRIFLQIPLPILLRAESKCFARRGLHQQAYMYTLSASDSCPPQQLYIEQAQLYWQKGCQEDAFTTLKRSFSNCFQPAQYYKSLPSGERLEERKTMREGVLRKVRRTSGGDINFHPLSGEASVREV